MNKKLKITTVALATACILAGAYAAASKRGGPKNTGTTADTVAPATSISSPGASQTVSGTVAVSVAASDNVGVTKVELYVNGALSGTSATAPYSFSWDTSAMADGAATLTAMAYDAAGNKTTSGAVSARVRHQML